MSIADIFYDFMALVWDTSSMNPEAAERWDASLNTYNAVDVATCYFDGRIIGFERTPENPHGAFVTIEFPDGSTKRMPGYGLSLTFE